MSNFEATLAEYVVNAFWQVPLLAGAGWIACRLLGRLGALAQHRMWVVVLFGSVILPACQGTTAWRWTVLDSSAGRLASSRVLAGEVAAMHAPRALMLPGLLLHAVCLLYVGIFVFALARLVISLRDTFLLIKRARRAELNGEEAAVWDATRQRFGLAGGLILTSSDAEGPAALYLGGPILLLPSHFSKRTSLDDFRAAVAHEAAHLERHDFLKNLVYEWIGLLIAFHPVTRLIKDQVAQTREIVCDAKAVAVVGGSRPYIQSLLRLAGLIAAGPRAIPSHAIGIFDANILEKRIMTLRAKKVVVPTAVRYGLVLAACVCLSFVAVGGAAAAVRLGVDDAGSRAGQGAAQVYTIGKDVTAPKLRFAPEPEFPKYDRKKGDTFNGTCVVALTVDSEGMPHQVHVARSLRPDFDREAVKAVSAYRFSPAMRRGKPVAVAMNVEVNFQLF